MTTEYRYSGPKKIYRSLAITNNDALWLMRMCYGEDDRASEEEVAAMCWSMVNRFTLHPGRRVWPNFIYMVRRFSQPINPRWQRGGDLAILATKSNSAYRRSLVTEKKLGHREKICNLKEEDIPSQIRNAVKLFQAGELFPPDCLVNLKDGRISNWANNPDTRSKFPHGIAIGSNPNPKKKNWFFADKVLIDGFVKVVKK